MNDQNNAFGFEKIPDDDDIEAVTAAFAKTPEGDAQGNGAAGSPLVLTLAEWAARDLPEADCLLGEILTTTTRALLAADTGIGKTIFSIAAGMRSAANCGFLNWSTRRPARILYIDGEMSRRLLKQRLADEVARLDCPPPDTFFALSREDLPGLQPLNTVAGQKTIEAVIREYCGGIDAIIFDNIMALISGSHTEEEGWAQTLPWIRDLTRRAIGQLWVHHTGHDTSRQYGTKTREWEMDTYAQLDKIEQEGTDLSFLLSFRKARERRPDNREQFVDTRISLIGNRWLHVTEEDGSRKTKPSPEALKFLVCLRDVATDSVASIEGWRDQCTARGLIGQTNKPDSDRSLFSKYKRELITRNWIACDLTTAWILP
jgi:AAA domain